MPVMYFEKIGYLCGASFDLFALMRTIVSRNWFWREPFKPAITLETSAFLRYPSCWATFRTLAFVFSEIFFESLSASETEPFDMPNSRAMSRILTFGTREELLLSSEFLDILSLLLIFGKVRRQNGADSAERQTRDNPDNAARRNISE